MNKVNPDGSCEKGYSLEEIINNEIFKQKKENIFKTTAQRIEKTLLKNKNKVLVPLNTALGGLTTYFIFPAMENLVYIANIMNPDASLERLPLQMSLWFGALIGGGSYIALDDIVKNYIGKKICGIKELGHKLKKKKENFFHRHRLGITLTAWTATTAYAANTIYQKIISLPLESQQTISQNMDKLVSGVVPFALGWLSALYLSSYALETALSLKNKDIWKQLPGVVMHKLISKKAGIRYLEKQSKKGNIYADLNLANYKRNLDEKLEHKIKVIEKIKQDKVYHGQETDFIKYQLIAENYLKLRKKDPDSVLSIAMQTYPVNPQRAIKFFNKLSRIKELNIKPEVLSVRNYFLNIHEKDNPKDWEELMVCANEEERLEFLKTGKGTVFSFMDREFLNKNFIFKRFLGDKSRKFLIEKSIWKKLKHEGVLVENPLFFYDKEGIQTQIFIRNGEENLREKLKSMVNEEKKEIFNKILGKLNIYQQKIYWFLEKHESGFLLNSEHRGTSQKILVPQLDLEKNLMQRAFSGYENKEKRLGENDYLFPLLTRIKEYRQENYSFLPPTFNHGDLFGTNITDELCFIDPRPKIASLLYDFTHISLDPEFLSLDFASRKEKILEEVLKNNAFTEEERELKNEFDNLYLHNSLCLAGAHIASGETENTAIILNELIEFSKEKPYEKELHAYLKHSNAKELLRII